MSNLFWCHQGPFPVPSSIVEFATVPSGTWPNRLTMPSASWGGGEGKPAPLVHALDILPVVNQRLVREGMHQLHHVTHGELPARIIYRLVVDSWSQLRFQWEAVRAASATIGPNSLH
jgi:hypothetical protein